MENKTQGNNLEVEEEERVSIYTKIVEFVVFYLIANVVINAVYYFLFYTLNTAIDANGFAEFVKINGLINIGVIVVDIFLICISVNIFNKLYFRTLCKEYKTLEKILVFICAVGVVIGFIVSGVLNKELNLTSINVHYVHYIFMTIVLIKFTVDQYSKMCKSASLDDFRNKHNIEKRTDWI